MKTLKLPRQLVSITLSCAMLGMLITGLLSYFLPYTRLLSGIHTWFGLVFAIILIWHLINNSATLVRHITTPGGKRWLGIGSTAALVIILGVTLSFPPFSTLLEYGFKFRQQADIDDNQFQTIALAPNQGDTDLRISLRTGEHYYSPPQPLFLGLTYQSTPQMVFWLEDLEGNYLETLYVTSKVASSNFRNASFTDTALQRRPESLPYWAHKRGITDADGLLVPQANNADLDGVTAATPIGHYDVKTQFKIGDKPVRLMLEINRSYDFNSYYSRDRFPNDPIYSGSGSSGQPSLIYSATLGSHQQHYILQPIGHGHHSGQDGELYSDLSNFDTALDLVDLVVASVSMRNE